MTDNDHLVTHHDSATTVRDMGLISLKITRVHFTGATRPKTYRLPLPPPVVLHEESKKGMSMHSTGLGTAIIKRPSSAERDSIKRQDTHGQPLRTLVFSYRPPHVLESADFFRGESKLFPC